ncbi:ArnT family glycosyltransferase [Tenacibaculum jejuense]|nr:glycosyltransferase family 39 protein [Tenacibaculum jejuense]
MKKILTSKYSLLIFLVLLSVINIIQGYTTELIADEAYYWVYSNYMDWGYFDHPPMVAVWISISKFFFSSGELSVRFFSSITLSITFFWVWLLIKHPNKQKYVWLYILLVLSTSLFNVYGFITVPDTPLMFFYSLFLLGYQKYLDQKNFLSYLILAVAMAGMLYSKYHAVLIILFVLLSNLKVLKDWKIWFTTLVTIILFFPHLYWQFSNDFPSIKYHLYERSSRRYHFYFTAYHFLNLMVIIGFTFPIIYKALYKRLHIKDKFETALRFLAVGFAVFFFISSFKNQVQAQWIVPMSIPLVVIPFYYLINHVKDLKLFKKLALATLIVTFGIRICMANDGILPKQFEMHGNKKWVEKIENELGDITPLFLNSYQNTSLYWFYSGKRPIQINTWNSRKNQYDLYEYNKNFELEEFSIVTFSRTGYATDSITKKNRSRLFIEHNTNGYKKVGNLKFEIKNPILKAEAKNSVTVSYDKQLLNKFDGTLALSVILKLGSSREIIEADLNDNQITFELPLLDATPTHIQIVGTPNPKIWPVRLSTMEKCSFIE